MTACVIDGRQCTTCCRAISVYRSSFQAINKSEFYQGSDFLFIKENWQQISARRAKQINRYHYLLGTERAKEKKRSVHEFMWFTCKKVTDSGCSVYDSRPQTCKLFPRYLRSETAWNEYVLSNKAEYRPDCTEHVVVVIDRKESGDVQPVQSPI